jgi:hypothetical protein
MPTSSKTSKLFKNILLCSDYKDYKAHLTHVILKVRDLTLTWPSFLCLNFILKGQTFITVSKTSKKSSKLSWSDHSDLRTLHVLVILPWSNLSCLYVWDLLCKLKYHWINDKWLLLFVHYYMSCFPAAFVIYVDVNRTRFHYASTQVDFDM